MSESTFTVESSLRQLPASASPIVIAFGVFDGVHSGHQAILSALLAMSEESSSWPVVFFFEPFPRAVLAPEHVPRPICTVSAKLKRLAASGMRAAVQYPFTRATAALSPEAFLEQEVFSAQREVRGFCVGENWRFGRGNCGDGRRLTALAAARGVATRIVSAVHRQGGVVSSTRIRHLIGAGRLGEASDLLGRRYSLSGVVSGGLGLAGSSLGCPTANIAVEGLQLPPYGVYGIRARIGETGARYGGVAYLGDAPSLRPAGLSGAVLEVNLFDFSGDLYGRELDVELLGYLRPSLIFASAAALAAQICDDIAAARALNVAEA